MPEWITLLPILSPTEESFCLRKVRQVPFKPSASCISRSSVEMLKKLLRLMGIQANGILYFPNLWQKDSACAFSFSIFSFVWNKGNIGCFKSNQLLQCYHRQKCKLHIYSSVNNLYWYHIFSCYITDRMVAVLICTFTSISFQWVNLHYRNVESQSFCSNSNPEWTITMKH